LNKLQLLVFVLEQTVTTV